MGEATKVGERWAYRERAAAPVTQVEVVAIGTKRPPRVQVQFVDNEFEGRVEWVPPGRLKVPWAGVDRWLDIEAKYAAVVAASQGIDPAEEWAAAWALEPIGEDIIETYVRREEGVSRIVDPARLVDLLDTEPTILEDDRAFTDEDGAVVVPWTVTRRLAERSALKHAENLLDQVDRDEAEARRDAIYGRHYPDRKGGWFTPPEVCARVDEETWKPARATLREWCGQEARERHDELAALRDEVRRLGRLIEAAAISLHDAGLTARAKEFEDELGVPVEVLRRRRR